MKYPSKIIKTPYNNLYFIKSTHFFAWDLGGTHLFFAWDSGGTVRLGPWPIFENRFFEHFKLTLVRPGFAEAWPQSSGGVCGEGRGGEGGRG